MSTTGKVNANNIGYEVQAFNQLNTYALVYMLINENPKLVENIIKNSLGSEGISGIVNGLTQPLSAIDSINITDLNSSADTNSIEKIASAAPEVLYKFIEKMKILGMDNILSKINLNDNMSDNKKLNLILKEAAKHNLKIDDIASLIENLPDSDQDKKD